MSIDIYVDGSYIHDLKKYSYGVIVVIDENPSYMLYGFGSEPHMVSMRNVAGEILGAQMAMNFAFDQGMTEINLYYDYIGIEAWCNGSWKANKRGTILYKEFYNTMNTMGLKVNFHKVKAHTGVLYNEWADRAANKVWDLNVKDVKNSSAGHHAVNIMEIQNDIIDDQVSLEKLIFGIDK